MERWSTQIEGSVGILDTIERDVFEMQNRLEDIFKGVDASVENLSRLRKQQQALETTEALLLKKKKKIYDGLFKQAQSFSLLPITQRLNLVYCGESYYVGKDGSFVHKSYDGIKRIEVARVFYPDVPSHQLWKEACICLIKGIENHFRNQAHAISERVTEVEKIGARIDSIAGDLSTMFEE